MNRRIRSRRCRATPEGSARGWDPRAARTGRGQGDAPSTGIRAQAAGTQKPPCSGHAEVSSAQPFASSAEAASPDSSIPEAASLASATSPVALPRASVSRAAIPGRWPDSVRMSQSSGERHNATGRCSGTCPGNLAAGRLPRSRARRDIAPRTFRVARSSGPGTATREPKLRALEQGAARFARPRGRLSGATSHGGAPLPDRRTQAI